jgi:hypothetical protein
VFLTPLLLVAFFLRVAYLNHDRFHGDEALYAGWALRILDDDPLLLDEPVDKPPLYLYALAATMHIFGRSEVAARLPNLAASIASIALVYRLGAALYGRRTGLWAALFVSLSPFDILFARTAFTDSWLVLWTLLAANTLLSRRWFWAGLALGLAFATKQHAIVLAPLVLLLWLAKSPVIPSFTFRNDLTVIPSERSESRDLPRRVANVISSERSAPRSPYSGTIARILASLLGLAIPVALATWWNSARWAIRPGYWRQSALSYGGLAWAAPATWGARFLEWSAWARYLVGSPLLYALLLSGTAALLAWGWRTRRGSAHLRRDTTLVGYAVGYLVLHTVLSFSIWDRYLLPLVPIAALLLARIVEVGSGLFRALPSPLRAPVLRHRHPVGGARLLHSLRRDTRCPLMRPVARTLVLALVLLVALYAGGRAALNGYPVGGEHWAYQGLDHVVAYIKQHAAPDAAIYHHWLRWHYTYYLYGTGFELRWWENSAHLCREVLRTPGQEQYLVLPAWGTLDPTAPDITLDLVYETRRQDGSISFHVYRVHPAP